MRKKVPVPTPSYGKRADNTEKGGYFGELKRPDGDVSTELSIGVDYGSGEKEIPTLVPTLTKEEVDHLLSGGEPTDAITRKAVEFAVQREEEEQACVRHARGRCIRHQPPNSQITLLLQRNGG